MYDLSILHERYPDYLINMDILGDGYKNPIYVSFLPPKLDNAVNMKQTKRVIKYLKLYKNSISKDVYNKLCCDFNVEEK